MLLLTRVVTWGPDTLVGEVDVAGDSPFAEPGLGIPRWVALEYMAQAVGALDGIRLRESGRQVPPGYLLGTRRLDQIDGYFQPGVTVRITVSELLQGDHGLGVFSCLLNDGERAMSCQLTVYRPAPGGAETGG
jgi:predicted hotdog family 3-hydroxylacyl-ACP dehydratase